MPLSPLRLPALTPELERNFAWQYYYAGPFRAAGASARHVRWRRFHAAAQLLRTIPPPRRLLDVGCGPGESTVYLERELGPQTAVGVDLRPDHAFARALALANGSTATFAQGSATALPLLAERFDMVVSFEMIEHLPHWRRFLAEARRVVVPGGHLLLTTPNRRSIHALGKAVYGLARGFPRRNAAWQRDGDFYERLRSDREIAAALGDAGFRLKTTRHVAFVLTPQPAWTLGVTAALERVLERMPFIRRFAVTTLMLAQAT